jgi:hypothetical protein
MIELEQRLDDLALVYEKFTCPYLVIADGNIYNLVSNVLS